MGINASKYVKPGASALAIAIALGGAYEGTRLKAYHDPGNGTPTICMGETHGVFMGMTKTLAECQTMFAGSMGQREKFVRARIKNPPWPETRIAAFADFAYNEGEGQLLHSVAWNEANTSNVIGGCEALMNFTTYDGKCLQGLANRRESERDLCLMGTGAVSLSPHYVCPQGARP